jgi:hypothetical protein
MIDTIQAFINDAESKGIQKGVHFNSIIIPFNLVDVLEEETEKMLIAKDPSIKDHKLFDLEILISGENEKIRFAKIY